MFYEADAGRMQVVQVPWDCNARYRMPVAAWRRAIEAHYPHRTWVPVHAETLARLQRLKLGRGLPSYDAVIDELLWREGGR